MSWIPDFWKFRNTPDATMDGNTPNEEFKLEAQLFRRRALYVLLHPRRWYRLQQLKKEFRVGLADLPAERGSIASDETSDDEDEEHGGGEWREEGRKIE